MSSAVIYLTDNDDRRKKNSVRKVAAIWYFIEFVAWCLGALFVKRQRQLAMQFTDVQKRLLVYSILIEGIVSVVPTVTFLLGESASCLLKNQDATCDDIIRANMSFSFIFASTAFIRIYVFPFKTENYTSANLVRFNFHFQEQVKSDKERNDELTATLAMINTRAHVPNRSAHRRCKSSRLLSPQVSQFICLRAQKKSLISTNTSGRLIRINGIKCLPEL